MVVIFNFLVIYCPDYFLSQSMDRYFENIEKRNDMKFVLVIIYVMCLELNYLLLSIELFFLGFIILHVFNI